jgi:hypothetical protein
MNNNSKTELSCLDQQQLLLERIVDRFALRSTRNVITHQERPEGVRSKATQ